MTYVSLVIGLPKTNALLPPLCIPMRLEIQIALLFMLSLGALVFHYAVPRTHQIDYRGEGWESRATFGGDSQGGTTSRITDRGMETRIKLVDRSVNGYCAAVFEKASDESVSDLSWCSHVELTAWIEGRDSENFRLFIRNRLPGIYSDDDAMSRQYNEVALMLNEERQNMSFPVEHFHVPSWWVEAYGKTSEHSIPSFDAVDMIEVSVGSSVKKTDLTLIVEKVAFLGHWIPPMVLYRSLLASWLVLGAGVFLQRLLDINTALKQSNEREVRLRQINDSLEFKATELSRLAHHDSLTGLMNRLGILQYAELAKGAVVRGEKVSLCILDIDDFKTINDTHGHNHGDEILTAIGGLLSESATNMELFARWGGEEFIAICFDSDEQNARKLAERIGRMIESQIGVTCSLGVCEVYCENEKFLDTVDRADNALYAAKKQGKNRAVAWSDIETRRTPAHVGQAVSD